MSSSPSRGAAALRRRAPAAAAALRRRRRGGARCRRRRRHRARCRARGRAAGSRPAPWSPAASSRPPGSTPGGDDAQHLADLDQVRIVEVVPAHQVLPVLAVVEADPDQRVAGLDGVVAGLAAVAVGGRRLRRRRPPRPRSAPGWRRRRWRAASPIGPRPARGSASARSRRRRRSGAEPARRADGVASAAGPSISGIGAASMLASSAGEPRF